VSVSIKKSQTSSAPREADNRAAFEAIFQEHWERVYAVIFRLVGDRDEAEDLALETFWRLHQQPPRRRDNLAGWLYRVATNLGLNALRARKRRRQYEEQAGALSFESASPVNPAMEVERAERRARVRRALAQMKPRSAKTLILRYSGLSYAEVAAAIGVSPNSVGTLLTRAEREFEQRYRALEGS
jgi:RNA polymerase sigma-70 factor (ECF subfamily)